MSDTPTDRFVVEELARIVQSHGHNLNSTASREERNRFISEVIELYNFEVIELLTRRKVTDPRKEPA